MSPHEAQGYLLTSYSIAGGETVSTFLTATTYYLCQNPQPYQKLREEIRAHYQSYDQIDAATALQLPYLQAVIQEGLRIFPPGSQGFPRTSPGVVIDDNLIPAGVSNSVPGQRRLLADMLTNSLYSLGRLKCIPVHGR